MCDAESASIPIRILGSLRFFGPSLPNGSKRREDSRTVTCHYHPHLHSLLSTTNYACLSCAPSARLTEGYRCPTILRMPQAAKKDISSQRAQEKESKRARGALSCAECRRLKLKCDKTVPCSRYSSFLFGAHPDDPEPEYARRPSYCKRRGCSAICPNGSLITGQGTRFVLADTEKLHHKIATMSDRIRHLEDALAVLQSTVTNEPHPLLDRDLLKIKSSIELHSAVDGAEDGSHPNGNGANGSGEGEDFEEYIDAFGTLAIREDGAATFYGRSAGSESLLMGEGPSAASSPIIPHTVSSNALSTALGSSLLRRQDSYPPSSSITSFTSSFPFSSGGTAAGIDLDFLTSQLPPYTESARLCELYLAQAPWFFGAVTRDQITDEILPLWFPEEAPRPTGAGAPRDGSPPPIGGAHDLALLYVIFCFGALGDVALPFPTSHNTNNGAIGAEDLQATSGPRDSEFYYRLTKAALTLEPVLEGPPSVATVQTLALMAIFEGLCAGENSIESTWAIFGLSTKLAQSIGLHRDCARWGLKAPEVQKRRALFWELFITDCWQALATGRLPTFSLPFVDCELPQDVDQTFTEDGTPQPSFPYWKARFGAECVSAVVQGTLTSRAPKYSIILELDRKIRDMELPKYATGSTPEGLGLSQTMSHFMPINYRHLTLLYIHRCFFAHAISNHPNDPIKSPYAPSFLAGYRSACDLLASLRLQFNKFPAEIARFWVLWTHAFSSAIMLSSVVTHATRSKVAPAALLELGKACELFEAAAKICPNSRAGKFVPILHRLSKKAVQVFEEARNGAPSIIPNNIFEPSRLDAQNDELSIFSGKTHTLTTKAKPPENTLSVTAQRGRLVAVVDTVAVGFAQTDTNGSPFVRGRAPELERVLSEWRLCGADDRAGPARGAISNAGGRLSTSSICARREYRRQRDQELRYRAEQQRQQQQQQQQQSEYAYQSPPSTFDPYSPPHGIAPSPISPAAPHQHALAHSSSHRSMRQAYQQQAPQQLGHSHHSQANVHHPAPEMPSRSRSLSQSRRNLRQAYDVRQDDRSHHEQFSGVPPGYKRHPSQIQSPNENGGSSSSSQGNTPEAMYMDDSPTHSPYQTLNPHYWPAPGGYAAPPELAPPPGQTQAPHGYNASQDPRQRHRVQLDQHQLQLRQINLQLGAPQTEHYTPDGAMRGFAAEDSRLQEHWQSYMAKVGSPRMIQDA
ncbi:Fungal-trans domain-containing protein [Mycena venus]|uniref:Fungal-trans domain-containing protein n=1 Tax=Mycena venus TaxID=2733690 RepID=A0A8H7CN23_9AGAR|nr:Fungal-trans domain-containing protein [Mycena venus]